MHEKEAKSPREIMGVREEPLPSDMPLTTSEAKSISAAIGKTVLTNKRGELSARTKKLSVVVAGKMSEELEAAGVTKKKIALTIAAALGAETMVKVGEKEYSSVPDHRVRLSAVALVKDLLLEPRGPNGMDDGDDSVFGAFTEISLEEIQSLRVQTRIRKKQKRVVPPLIEKMVSDGQQ